MSEKVSFALEGLEFSALPDNAGDDDQPVLHRVQILKAGGPDGVLKLRTKRKVKVTSEDILAVMADLQSRTDALPMIRMHGKGPWGEEAIGWFRSFEATARGIYGEVEWLPDHVDSIRNKAWRYTSPGMLGERDADGYLRPRVILEVSATNTNDIDAMLPLAASASSDVTFATDRQTDTKEYRHMKLTENALKALGFKPTDTPTDEEVEQALLKIAAVADVVAAGASKPPVMVSTPKPDGTLPVAVPSTAPPAPVQVAASALSPELLSSLTATMEAAFEAKYEAREKATKVKALVAEGFESGKLTAKSKDEFEKLASLDLSAATAVLAQMAVLAPVKGGKGAISTSPIKVDFSAGTAPASKAEMATKVFQLAREKGITTEQAAKFITSREAN